MHWAVRSGFRHLFDSAEAFRCLNCDSAHQAGTPIPLIGTLRNRIKVFTRLSMSPNAFIADETRIRSMPMVQTVMSTQYCPDVIGRFVRNKLIRRG